MNNLQNGLRGMWLAAFLLVAVATACSDSTSLPILASVSVTPATAAVAVTQTKQFVAAGKDNTGSAFTISPTWSVTGGGTISTTGLFTAPATAGTSTIKATSVATNGTFSGTATAVVSTSTSSGGGTGTGSGHGPAPVPLLTAVNYVILAKSGVSNVPTSAITGNIGLSPAAASFITGFPLTLDASGTFSTTPEVTGNLYAADYTAPTPSNMTTAINDMMTAYTTAAGRTLPDYTELGAGNIGGLTLAPGLYKWSTGVLIPTSVTLSGTANDTWIFQIAGGITQSSATNVILTGGALAANVVWQVFGAVDIGTTAKIEGRILSQTSIVLRTGAKANGRLFAQTAVTLAANTVVVK